MTTHPAAPPRVVTSAVEWTERYSYHWAEVGGLSLRLGGYGAGYRLAVSRSRGERRVADRVAMLDLNEGDLATAQAAALALAGVLAAGERGSSR